MPRLNGCRTTTAPLASASAAVLSTRAVVDHDHVEVGRLAVDVAHHASDHPLLVVGGDDRELAELVVVARHGGWQGGSGGLQDPE